VSPWKKFQNTKEAIMSDLEVPVTDPQEAKSRYSVSRKGMGGRKPKYTEAELTAIVDAVKGGASLRAVCTQKGLPYVSIRSALKRTGVWPVVVS
jgi:hypothetical protein